MKKVFEKIKNSKRTSKVLAVVLATAVCATSVWHGFSKKPAEVVAAAEVAEDSKSYLSYVVDRMIGGLQEKFTILEIVPHESQGEFRYYIGDDRVEEGLEKNTALMEKYYSTRGRYKLPRTGKWDITDVWYDVGNAFSNFGYQFIYYEEEDRFEVESPKRFLNYVLPEYKEIFEDNIDLRTVEGNDLTEADILAADFIIISTGTHDNSTIACYNAFTNGSLKEDSYAVPDNIYKGTINSDGTGEMTPVTSASEITYNTYEMNEDGTYKSRDISWEMVELLWEYTINGKPVELSDGSVVTTAVPVIMDNQQFSNLNKDGNMYKYELLFRMLTKDQFATIKPYISNVDASGNEYINSENLNTGVFDLDKTFASEASAEMIRDNIYKICGTFQDGEYKDNNPPHAVYLTNDYWVFSGDSCLIPSNKDASYGQANVGFEERTGNPTTVIEVMRYLLGAKDAPVIKHAQVRILEIQPCTVFDYDTYEEVKALAKRLLLAVDGKDEEGNVICDALTEDNYDDPNANTCLYVDCMTSSAFNGINKDIVGEFDVVYMGTNDDILLKDDSGSTIYNDKKLDGYVYLQFGDLVKAKSGISMYYLHDFTKYTQSQMEVLDKASTASYTLQQLSAPNFRTANYGTEYRKVYQFNNNTKDMWAPYLAGQFENGYYYMLTNIEDKIATLKSKKKWDQLYSDNAGNVRLSGNDITSVKLAQLKEYVDSGKLLILDDNMYTNNSDIIYPTSNVSKIAKYIIDKGDAANKIKKERIGAMLLYIRNQNPKLTFTETPTDIAYDANGIVSTFNAEGLKLKFKFTIEGKANTSYSVIVYRDKNNDGIFYKSNDVTNDKNELFNSATVTLDADGKSEVTISRELPDNYNGLVSYKVEVIELDASGNERPYRAAKTGYTAVKGDELKDIKVLQILPVPTNNKAMTNAGTENLNMATNADFQKLLKQTTNVIGYNISITTMYTYEFEEKFKLNPFDKNNPDKNNFLEEVGYDMVVLGFADLYKGDDISNEYGALDCIDHFIDDGKAMLFTHDTISYSPVPNAFYNYNNTIALYTYHNDVNSWGKEICDMFRDTVGMDRYGISTEEFATTSAQIKDVDGNQVYGLQGINNMLIYRHEAINNYSFERLNNQFYTLYPYTTAYDKTKNNYETLMTTTKVTKLNDGQVTMFPYHVDEILTVAETHAQWYQLDMEDESIVVWYTLDSDNTKNSTYYGDNRKDAGNNYYIYSKGNITYSGAGHSEMSSIDELQLFVNTIVKAITAGNSTPEVQVIDSSYADGVSNVLVTPYADNYEFKFVGNDWDLLPYVGKFANAKVTWHNPTIDVNNDGIVDTKDYVVADLGNKVVSKQEVTLSIGGESTFTEFNVFDAYEDTMSTLIEDGYGVTFTIELTDMFGAKGTATVRLLKRDLFKLD